MSVELKPCPFCGGEAAIKKGKSYYTDTVQAHCTRCGASMPKEPINHPMYICGKKVTLNEEKAIQRTTNLWNKRADVKEMTEGIK